MSAAYLPPDTRSAAFGLIHTAAATPAQLSSNPSYGERLMPPYTVRSIRFLFAAIAAFASGYASPETLVC
jgi:hypothetical protein